MKSLVIVVVFGLACYFMGKSGDLLWMLVVLPFGVLTGIVASEADESWSRR